MSPVLVTLRCTCRPRPRPHISVELLPVITSSYYPQLYTAVVPSQVPAPDTPVDDLRPYAFLPPGIRFYGFNDHRHDRCYILTHKVFIRHDIVMTRIADCCTLSHKVCIVYMTT